MSGDQSYSAAALSVLKGLDAVRKRPGMYIGSTDERGLRHCLWEIIDNSVDEALGGHATTIDVTLHSDGSASVADNGRGIPVDINPATGLPGVVLVMTELHAGGKFGGGSYAASGGLHGVGASVVNALSEKMHVEVDRGGKTHSIDFLSGEPGHFDAKSQFKPGAKLTSAPALNPAGTGTRVRFWPERKIFTSDANIDLEPVLARARQTAFLVPGLAITVTDERPEQPQVESFCYTGGISDFVEHLATDRSLNETIHLTGTGSYTESIPVLQDDGSMVTQDVAREMAVEVALRWGTGYDTAVTSFVNIVATPKGGTHITGFSRALTRTLNDAVRSTKVLKATEESLTSDDIVEGLTAVVLVRIPEPQFEGQTKEILGTPAAAKIVSEIVSDGLRSWMGDKRNKTQARQVLEKTAAAMRSRIAARQTKEAARRKQALETSSLPAKLVDCRSTDPTRTELLIVEGDSALGTAKLARDSEFQALLPIRGKILNTQKADLRAILANTECAAIIQVMGAGSGRTFDLEAARYQRLIVLADADVDGGHIRCLLLTLVHRYMRPLLDAGRVYSAVPPLHRIEISGSKEYIYTYSEEEMRVALADLEKKGKRVKEIQRYKGLGEMDADQLAETTLSGTTRKLRRVEVGDAQAADTYFELLMGSDVAPRRDFIINNSALVKNIDV